MAKLITTIELKSSSILKWCFVAFFIVLALFSLAGLVMAVLLGLWLLLAVMIIILPLSLFGLKSSFSNVPSKLKVYKDYLEFYFGKFSNSNEKIYIDQISEIIYLREPLMRNGEYNMAAQSLVGYHFPQDSLMIKEKDSNKKHIIPAVTPELFELIVILRKYKHIKFNLSQNPFGWTE